LCLDSVPGLSKPRYNFNRAVRAIVADVAKRLPEFAHIRASQILVVAGEARRASRATVKPLCFGGGKLEDSSGRCKPRVEVKGRRMLYCITLRPLFFRCSTPQARVATLLHELFHISRDFDGTLDPGRRHHLAGETFEASLIPLVQRYLSSSPASTVEALGHHGEVSIWHWLEKPVASYLPRQDKVRTSYTEAQLFLGQVQMLTSPASPPSEWPDEPSVH